MCYSIFMNILLLEDTLSLNKALKELLEIEGHNVLAFSDGNDVLNNIDENIDLYLLDITVPNVNGLELLKLIMNFNPNSEVIMISSDQSIESLKTAYTSGCLDYIKKPFLLEELQLKVDRIRSKIDNLFGGIKFQDSIHSLTHKEKELLTLLVKHKNDLVTVDQIDSIVYAESTMTMNAMRSLVKRLRYKIDGEIIKTLPNQGYVLTLS